VRSSVSAARFAGDAPDLKLLAAEADVDRVVMGTLVRSGDQLRVSAQLVEAPGGTLRGEPVFQALLANAEAGRQHALAAFRDAGGNKLF
jgi:TolB-like protein